MDHLLLELVTSPIFLIVSFFLLFAITTVRLSIEQIQLVIWRRIVVVVVNVLKGAEKLDFLERVDG
jgi:hypothetical protein